MSAICSGKLTYQSRAMLQAQSVHEELVLTLSLHDLHTQIEFSYICGTYICDCLANHVSKLPPVSICRASPCVVRVWCASVSSIRIAFSVNSRSRISSVNSNAPSLSYPGGSLSGAYLISVKISFSSDYAQHTQLLLNENS